MGRASTPRMVGVVAAVAVALLAGACKPPTGSGSGGGGLYQFDAGATHASITREPLHPSFAYNPKGAPRGQLVVLFNGTGAGPLALSRLGGVLSAEGFHVIGLRYASGVGTQSACPDSLQDANPECHRQFRGEVVYGAGVEDPDGASFDHPSVNVSAANSVVHRLERHVDHLHQRYPSFGWDQFQQRADGVCAEESVYGACELHWDDVVAIGHSQGAGVALYLGKHHPLARVGMLSGAYDAWSDGSGGYTAAAWVDEGGFAVPPSRIGWFSHLSDSAIGLHRAVADALDVPGSEVLVSTQPPPYGQSRRLVTNATPACPFDPSPSHNATATDLCAPASAHDDAWRYLAAGE